MALPLPPLLPDPDPKERRTRWRTPLPHDGLGSLPLFVGQMEVALLLVASGSLVRGALPASVGGVHAAELPLFGVAIYGQVFNKPFRRTRVPKGMQNGQWITLSKYSSPEICRISVDLAVGLGGRARVNTRHRTGYGRLQLEQMAIVKVGSRSVGAEDNALKERRDTKSLASAFTAQLESA